jgi:outer membrane protein assembly factor BamB
MKQKIFTNLLILSSLLLLFTGCTSTNAASSSPGYAINKETAYLSFESQTFAVDLKNGDLLWRYPSNMDNSRQAYAAPAIGEGFIVVGDYDSKLTALDQTNGTKKWEFDGASDRYIGSALISDGMVYAPNSDHYLYALDSEGNLEWKFKGTGPNWTKPLADENMIYLASMDHNFYAFDKEFSQDDLVNAEDGSKTLLTNAKWSIDLEMAVVGDPVLDNGVAYVATIEGKLFAIDVKSEKLLWSFNDNGNLGAVWGAPVVTDDALFVGDAEGNIHAIDMLDGSALWPSPFSAGGKVVGSGAAYQEGAIFATIEGKIFMINLNKEPKTIANFEHPIYSAINIVGEQIVFAPASEASLLTAYDLNGFEVWAFLPTE